MANLPRSAPSRRPTPWQRLRSRPGPTRVLVALGAGTVVFVLVWFQPQALLFDTVVDEEFPTVATSREPAAPPSGPVVRASGGFGSLNRYTVVGEATVHELEDGSRTLRLEDFESTNGPDLLVYLTAADAADGDEAFDDDFVDLGVLTGNIGAQNYAIPADVDLEHHDTVVIWCRRFSTAFGAADLAATG